MPQKYCVVPGATGVLKSQRKVPATVGADVGTAVGGDDAVGAFVGAVGDVVDDAQMVNPALVTLKSDRQLNTVPARTARLLICAGVVSRAVDVPTVK
jgi:hypothetical protein